MSDCWFYLVCADLNWYNTVNYRLTQNLCYTPLPVVDNEGVNVSAGGLKHMLPSQQHRADGQRPGLQELGWSGRL